MTKLWRLVQLMISGAFDEESVFMYLVELGAEQGAIEH